MDLVTTLSRPPVSYRMVWIVGSLLFMFGSWLIGQGVWIHIKALLAQRLLQHAWQETLVTKQPVKPWPWADTWPIGRLVVPHLGIDQIILANASGQSLAFGPGKVGLETLSREGSEGLTVSGHRDTHFSFLREIQHGDTIRVQTIHRKWMNFGVDDMEILDSRFHKLPSAWERATLQLITCYPFDAVLPGGPLRYVVTAGPIAPNVASERGATVSEVGRSKGMGLIVDDG